MHREKRSILVVDSSSSFIFYIAMLLKKLQYNVQTASTAEDALGMIARQAPAVVITDTVLPRMNGVDLLKQIKTNSSLSFIPVMIHTAEAKKEVQDACMRTGCAGYFLKPVDPDVLYKAVQAATEATPRQNIRINVALKARISGASADAVARTEEVTTLSKGGLYVMTTAPEPVNAMISLKLFMRNREIAATAVVLYSSVKIGGPHAVPGMGLKFVQIEPEDRDIIREYIREQVMSNLAIEPRR